MGVNKCSGHISRRRFLRSAVAVGGAAAACTLLGDCGVPGTGKSGPLKIGVLLPSSDIYTALGISITEGMKMYFERTGYQAGGRDIQLLTEDESTRPEIAAQKARKLIEQDQVDLVAGIVSSSVVSAVRDYFHDNKKFLIIANAGSNTLTRAAKSPYIFRTSFTNWQLNWPMGTWAAANLGKTVFISVPDYAAGKDTISAFRNSFEAAGGQVVKIQLTPFQNMGDPAPFLAEIADAAPDFVYAFYSGTAALTFVKAYHDFGLAGNIPLAGVGFMVEQDVLPAHGDAALGVKSCLHWALTLDNPENKTFVEAYGKRTIQGGNKGANVFAVQGYDAAHLIVDALNVVQGDISKAAALRDAFGKVSFASPRGRFTMDQNTHTVINPIYIREVKKTGNTLANMVIANLGEVADPGNDSKDTKP